MKTMETSRDNEHEEDVVTRSRDALQGRAIVIIVHGLPEASIVGNNCGEGGQGGSVADETIMYRAKTMATTERGMRR